MAKGFVYNFGGNDYWEYMVFDSVATAERWFGIIKRLGIGSAYDFIGHNGWQHVEFMMGVDECKLTTVESFAHIEKLVQDECGDDGEGLEHLTEEIETALEKFEVDDKHVFTDEEEKYEGNE